MPDYRRYRLPGGCYFFTVNLLRTETICSSAKSNVCGWRYARCVRCTHFTWTAGSCFPNTCTASGPCRPATTTSRIAGAPSRRSSHAASRRTTAGRRCESRAVERGIWQRRFREHGIRDDRDYSAHRDYPHFNPVKHGLVQRVRDWPYSTFLRLVKQEIYLVDWAGGDVEETSVGE